MGVMLAGAALLGRVILGELVPWRAVMAIALITVAIVFLGTGAEEASEAMQATAGGQSADAHAISLRAIWAVLAACFSGLAFAILTVGMRKTVTENTSPKAIVFLYQPDGHPILGALGLDAIGVGWHAGYLTARDLAVMLATGVCNLMAFLLIAMSLQLTNVVRVNTINNALTTALTVLAGIVIFAEPTNSGLYMGIILTFVGIVLIGSIDSESEEHNKATAISVAEGE